MCSGRDSVTTVPLPSNRVVNTSPCRRRRKRYRCGRTVRNSMVWTSTGMRGPGGKAIQAVIRTVAHPSQDPRPPHERAVGGKFPGMIGVVASKPVIIDTDPGIDDAIAIFLALASPELDVTGLTTVFGNCTVDVSTRNALTLLEVAGRPDIPVARGAAAPVATDYLGTIPHIHGEDGLGDGGALPAPTAAPVDVTAAEFLCRHAPDATILALGPL